jgi:hypothetical protein
MKSLSHEYFPGVAASAGTSHGHGVGADGDDDDGHPDYQNPVEYESLMKAKSLSRIHLFAKARSASISSVDHHTGGCDRDDSVSTDALLPPHLPLARTPSRVNSLGKSVVADDNESVNGEAGSEYHDVEEDPRAGLFEDIPEYPHSSEFQRVIITETAEDSVNMDTIEACKALHVSFVGGNCIGLRE